MPIPDKWLVDMALAKQFISEAQAAEIAEQQQVGQQNTLLSKWLVKKGYLKSEQLAQLLQEYKLVTKKQGDQEVAQKLSGQAVTKRRPVTRGISPASTLPAEEISNTNLAPTVNFSNEGNQAVQSLAIPTNLRGAMLPEAYVTPQPTTVSEVSPGAEQTVNGVSFAAAPTVGKAPSGAAPTVSELPLGTVRTVPRASALPQTIHSDSALQQTQPAGRQTDENVPKTFGRYQIIRELGKGNMGRVFQVYDPKLNREVALKVMLAGEMADNSAIERFCREAQAMARLRHPNIIGICDIGEENKQHYFTMDLIKGRSLESTITNDRRHSPRKAAELIKKVANTLHYAHTQNVVHRDIKPSNIMIGDNGEPYLMDFGLAKAIQGGSRLSRTNVVMGTPSYMPPEQAQGKSKEIDARSDIYALGATLYELLTGRVPFPGNDVYRVIMDVVNKQPVPLHEICSHIPVDIENICLKCLAKDKKLRYATAQELADDLSRFLDGEAVQATKPGLSMRAWVKENRGKVGATIAALAMLVAFLFLSIRENKELTQINKELKEAKEKTLKDAEELKKKNEELTQIKDAKEKALLDKERAFQIAEKAYLQTQSLLRITTWLNLLNQNILPEEINSGLKIEKEFKQLSINIPRNSEVYLTWSKSYYVMFCNSTALQERQSYLEKILEKCEKAIACNPENYGAVLFGYNIVSSHIPEITRREPLLKKFLEFFPGQGENCYSYFRRACVISPSEEALLFIGKAIEFNQSFFEAYVKKGDICRKLRRYEDAEKAYKKAVEMRPSDAYARLHLSRNYLERAKNLISSQDKTIAYQYLKFANEEANIAKEREPSWVDSYCTLAEINLELGKLLTNERQYYWEQAIQYTEEMLQKNGYIERSYRIQEEIYANLAISYQKKGIYKESINAYQLAIKSIEFLLKCKVSTKESTQYSILLKSYQKTIETLIQKSNESK
jgi:serine/threonine protein kinase